MPRVDLNAITSWITVAAHAHPQRLAEHLMLQLDVSRGRAQRVLAKLVATQWLRREGTPRRPHHMAGLLRQVVQRYELTGLQEDLPWSRDFAPYFVLSDTVGRLARHAFTELLNNAIDHSGGSRVTVSMRQTPSHLQLLVSDDGCGLFERIESSFAIDDPALAMLELSKGKLSSQPQWHTGRGLYFTARIADVLDLHANAGAFQHRAWQANRWQAVRPAAPHGTSVFVAIALDTTRTLDEVLPAHSLDGRGYGFERTVVPLQLLGAQAAVLESRGQARRVGARLHAFARAELDFEGVDEVGHAFADELFRVFAREHPGVELVPVHMNPRVEALLASLRAPTARSADAGPPQGG